MACCGDVPTLETLAAVSILREHLPELKIRVVKRMNYTSSMVVLEAAQFRTGFRRNKNHGERSSQMTP